MLKIFTSPSRYIQGYDILPEIGRRVSHMGRRAFVVGGKTAVSRIREPLSRSMAESSVECDFAVFSGIGSSADVTELASRARRFGADFIVGAGGGLALDTAKGVAHELDRPLVTIPTIASTDAPCSAEALQYKEAHHIEKAIILKRNPDVVFVDTKIIVEAPARFFVAGMGDALSTWFEARTCSRSGAKNFSGGVAASAALAIARRAYDSLLEYGVAARMAVERHVVTPAVEMVIEANTLLSGIGFENCGVGAAHSVSVGIGTLKGAEDCLHGELVGFGTLVSLVLENYPKDDTYEVIQFCSSVGLPITLEQLGVREPSRADLVRAAEASFGEGSFMENLSFEVTPALVADCIIAADALGKAHKPLQSVPEQKGS
jgi:glycerol dehydrogenase